ncbi:MAG: phosphatidylinositol-specific phospholipase C1-like protein [Clostridiales bacterium]|jgi:hypothetical protein|nr:phosphatidylinositol-specific phospholipase C1-like protein [Clostridiales bacterium]
MNKAKKKKGFKIVLSVFFAAVFFAAAAFVIPAFYFAGKGLENDLAAQKARVVQLRENPGDPVDEQSFAAFDLGLDPLIHEIRTVNTHNSYRKMFDGFIGAYFDFFVPKKMQTEFVYEHPAFTEQLNDGVRGLEWDVRAQDGGFNLSHFAVVDYRSSAPDLTLALEEVLIWSNNNPDHVPVTILLEYKSEPWIMNPKIEKPGAETLKRLDKTIADAIGRDKLITPSDIIGAYESMKDAVAANNFPKLSEAKGKFMFLLHYGDELTPVYIGLDESLKSQTLFPTVQISAYDRSALEKYSKYASHILYNEPDTEGIAALVSANYIVRTRADEGMVIDAERAQKAILSGAQIVTTDFERVLITPKTDYYFSFGDGRTIGLR